MSDLAEAVLPLIRTRADLWRWSTANEHGRQMQEAVAILRQAAGSDDPTVVFAVTQKAIASALKVIMRADDSSGIIGDACRALLDLHPEVAARARPAVAKLVDWMITFQFDTGDQIRLGQGIVWNDKQPGDLVFVGYPGAGRPHHVAIYLGGVKILHARRTGDVLRYGTIGEFAGELMTVRRLGAGAPTS